MSADEYDPDDNFAHGLEGVDDIDEDAATEQLAWQWLLYVNPDDEDGAQEQFAAWQEAWLAAGGNEGDADPVAALEAVTDWRSSVQVDVDDAAALVDGLTQLAARVDVHIDWGVDDPADDADPESLMAEAHAALRQHGYTLWVWDAGSDTSAAWLAYRRDDDAVRTLASALGIPVRAGA